MQQKDVVAMECVLAISRNSFIKRGTMFTDKELQKVFDGFGAYTQQDALVLMDNSETVMNLMRTGVLNRFMKVVQIYMQMLRDVLDRRYCQLSKETIGSIVGTLLYVLSPMELVPDVFPMVGFLDDAAIVALCVKFTRRDVKEYKRIMKMRNTWWKKKSCVDAGFMR